MLISNDEHYALINQCSFSFVKRRLLASDFKVCGCESHANSQLRVVTCGDRTVYGKTHTQVIISIVSDDAILCGVLRCLVPIFNVNHVHKLNRVFHEHTELAILASQALLHENQKIQQQNITPVSIELRTSAIWI